MGSITNAGLAEVTDNLTAAKVEYEKARKAERDAFWRLEVAERQQECKHKNLTTEGGMQLVTTTCEDCGFTWYD